MQGKCNPFIALILSVLTPGLGQVYSSKLEKGILFFVLAYFLTTVTFLARLPNSFNGLIITIILHVGFFLFIISDAFIEALKIKEKILKPYHKWYLYLIIILFNFAFSQVVIVNVAKANMLRPFRIPSGAMEPTLHIGDCLITDFNYYKINKLKPGDVIVFKYPLDTMVIYIKRCVAVGGQTVEIKDKILYVDGKVFDDPTKIKFTDRNIFSKDMGNRDNFDPYVVPKGYIFVMGDNRDNSYDSRFWGPLDRKLILGKPLYLYWSKEKSRIGLTIH